MHVHCTADHPAEEWKPIAGFEGWYEVSNLARVRRIRPGTRTRIGYILKPKVTQKGYFAFTLMYEGRRVTMLLHRMVAFAFLGLPPTLMHQVNHIDGVKTHCLPSNLEWSTCSENHWHASRLGLMPCGERHHRAKLTLEQVRAIRVRYPTATQRQLARIYGVGQSTIGRITRGINWRSI